MDLFSSDDDMDFDNDMQYGSMRAPLPMPSPPSSPRRQSSMRKMDFRSAVVKAAPMPFNYDEGLDGLELLIEAPPDHKAMKKRRVYGDPLFCAQRVLLPRDDELDHHMIVVSNIAEHMRVKLRETCHGASARITLLLNIKRQITQHLWSLRVVSELAQTDGAALQVEAHRLMGKVTELCEQRKDMLLKEVASLAKNKNTRENHLEMAKEYPLACATKEFIPRLMATATEILSHRDILLMVPPLFAYMSTMGIHGSGSVHVQTRCDWGTFSPLDKAMSQHGVPILCPNVVAEATRGIIHTTDAETQAFVDYITSYDDASDSDVKPESQDIAFPRILLDYAFVHRDAKMARRAVAWLDQCESDPRDFTLDLHAAQLGTAWNHEREKWLCANDIIRKMPVHFVDTAATAAVRKRSQTMARLMELTKLKVAADEAGGGQLPTPPMGDGREQHAVGSKGGQPQPTQSHTAKSKGRGKKNKKKKGRRK